MHGAEKILILILTTIGMNLLLFEKQLKGSWRGKDVVCSRFPRENDIFIDNIIWQVLETKNGFMKLLNAYLDTRWNKTLVRVNANGPDFDRSNGTVFCQFWSGDQSLISVVQATDFQALWVKPDFPMPENNRLSYMIICPYDPLLSTPKWVSLVNDPCDGAENNLKIIDNQPLSGIKKEFGICVKHVTYEDREFAFRFVEWVHLMRILGVSKIHMSNRFVHKDLLKVLVHFEEKDFIEVLPFLEPTGVPDIKRTWEARTLELNTINDCFYRVRNLYKYIIIVDPDEVITPMTENIRNWHELLESLELNGTKYDAFLSHNLIFPNIGQKRNPDFPPYHYILQHTQRASTFLMNKHYYTNFKSILVPDDLISVFNHGPLACHNRNCSHYIIPDEICQLSHYRIKVQRAVDNITIPDMTLIKYKDELVKLVNNTLNEMKLEY